MELRLQQFIESVEVLADIRNLDTFNPIVFQLEYPVTATRFTIVGSKVEPSYLGIPVNTTWIVLDPQSPYYRMALKLVDVNNPDQSTTLPSITDATGTIVLYWNIIRSYDEIFSKPQYYTNAGRGPKGDPGADGKDGVVDYNLAIARLAQLTGTLTITAPDTINENSTQALTLMLSEVQILADGTITPATDRMVTAPIFLIGQVPANTYIDANNVLHVGELTADTPIVLTANYPSWAKNALAQKTVTLKNTAASVTGVTVTGPDSIQSGNSGQYVLTATWSDGTTTHPTATWALDATGFGSINAAGLLTVPSTISSSGSVNVSASVTINGVNYVPNKTVIITKQVVAPTVSSVEISGSHAVNSNSATQYSVNVHWSDGTTTHPSASWSLNTSVFGSISSQGILNVPDTISSSGTVTITATVSAGGNSYQPTLAVAVTKIVVPPSVVDVQIAGSASVINGSDTQYQMVVTWSNGTTTHPSPDSWNLDSTAFGSISATGMLSVPADITAEGTVKITAPITIDGGTHSPTLNVAVRIVHPSAVAPYYGTGAANYSDWDTFIKSLHQYPSPSADGKYQMSFDAIGSSTFMYFAYPQEHGESTFYDKLSQFFGGFGGAGNPNNGPSQQTITNYKDMPITVNIDVGGVSTPFYVYRSDFANLGAAAANQWEVTLATP